MVKNQNIIFKDMSKSIAPAIVPVHLLSSSWILFLLASFWVLQIFLFEN